jgi:hypothetical protein
MDCMEAPARRCCKILESPLELGHQLPMSQVKSASVIPDHNSQSRRRNVSFRCYKRETSPVLGANDMIFGQKATKQTSRHRVGHFQGLPELITTDVFLSGAR